MGCYTSCQRTAEIRTLALTSIGAILKVGGVLQEITSFILKDNTKSSDENIDELVDYVNARINEALLETVKHEWSTISQAIISLQNLIDSGNTGDQAINECASQFNIIISCCVRLSNKLSSDLIEPISRMAYISQVGMTCVQLYFERLYLPVARSH